MSKESTERRRANRRPVRLPVEVGPDRGWTRDISPSGVYFETARARPGDADPVHGLLEGPSPRPLRLECQGRIIRTERRAGMMGVAVAIIASRWLEGPE